MSDLCTLLDAYLDASLSEDQSDRFENHAMDCEACASALSLPADLDDALSGLAVESCPPDVLASALAATESEWPDAWSDQARGLAEISCPPAVLNAALRQTRRAPDRSQARMRRRASLRWAVGLAAVLAVALAWSMRSSPEPEAPRLARTLPAAPVDSSSASTPNPLAAVVDDGLPLASAEPPSQAPPAPAPSPQVPPSAPAPAPPVERVTQAEAPPTPAPPDETAPSAEEIDAAREDLALAFALIDDAQSKARARIRTEAGPLSSTLDQTLPF